jgi:hypothetical protein
VHLWDRGDGCQESLRFVTSHCWAIDGVHHYVDVRRQCTRRRATVRERARGRSRRDACTAHPTRAAVTAVLDKVEGVRRHEMARCRSTAQPAADPQPLGRGRFQVLVHAPRPGRSAVSSARRARRLLTAREDAQVLTTTLARVGPIGDTSGDRLPRACVLRGDQRRSEAIRGTQRRSEAIRGTRRRSLRCNQMQSDAIRCNQMQSDAIRCPT